MSLLRPLLVLCIVPCYSMGPLAAQGPCGPTQTQVEGGPFFEAWVDPSHGVDALGIVSTPGGPLAAAKGSPFKTIQAAINAVFAFTFPQNPIVNPGIVHLEPGVYDLSSPIQMKNGVNLKGFSARNCVLRNGGPRQGDIFFPDTTISDCGSRRPGSVIVDYTTSTVVGPGVFSELIDSVTFQGGDVQVYAEVAGQDLEGRISNCLFDMIDYDGLMPGPEFAILTVHIFNGATEDYESVVMNVFNNTFIMEWCPNGAQGVLGASSSAIGICDVNDPRCGDADGDPLKVLRNIGLYNVQNNLFKEPILLDSDNASLLGIPFEDTSVYPGYNTNAFETWASVGHPIYSCRLRPGTHPAGPVSLEEDPAFVGEMLTNLFALPALSVGRDWRVLPDSFVVDLGIGPTNGMLRTGTDVAPLIYTEPSVAFADCAYSPIDSFSFDGEGYGNRRVVGEQIDVGFDEFEMLIDSGYGNESVSIPSSTNPCSGVAGDPCYCVPFAGAGNHGFVFSGGGNVLFRLKNTSCPGDSYTMPPGAVFPPSVTPSGIHWFSSPLQTNSMSLTVYSGYTPPAAIYQTSHSFGFVTVASNNNGKFRLFQAHYGGLWSNLQASFD